MRRRTDDVLVLLFVAGLLGAYFLYFIRSELADLGRASLWSSFDLLSYFLPRFSFGADSMLHGRVPLWNPFEFGGLPFLATGQPAVFYPPTILLFGLLPREPAEWTYLVFHYAMAGGTMFYFLRRSGMKAPSILIGISVWLFSVPILSSNYHPPRIGHLAWTPLIFALVDRVGAGNRRAFAAMSLVVAVQLVCGYPEFAMDASLLVAIHAVASWAAGTWKNPPWRSLPYLGGAFVLGAVTASVQLVPLGELGRLASRELLLQKGAFAFPKELGLGPVLITVPGLIGFTLLGLFPRRARAALAGFLFCLVIGNGGWKILRLLPGFSFIRFPLVWLYLWTFYIAWVAALGADEIVQVFEQSTAKRTRAFAMGLVASGVLLALLYVLGLRWVTDAPGDIAKRISFSVQNVTAAALGTAGALGFAALAALSLRRRVPAIAWMTATALVVLAQFAAFPFGARPSPFHPPSPVGLAAQFRDEHGPLHGRVLAPDDILYGYEVTDRMPSPLGVEQSFLPYRQRRIVDKLGFISMFGRLDWAAVARAKGYLDAMNVELVVTPPSVVDALANRGLVESARSETESFMTNPGRMGSAWVNYAVRRANGLEQALEYFVGDEFDPHREAIVEATTESAYPLPGLGTPPATAPLTEQRPSSTRVSWDVELERPGIFIASESAYPGWEATVDGHAASWITADYVLRGVELGAGRHSVTFEYRPLSFRVGAALSIAGLALIGIIGVIAPRRRGASKV